MFPYKVTPSSGPGTKLTCFSSCVWLECRMELTQIWGVDMLGLDPWLLTPSPEFLVLMWNTALGNPRATWLQSTLVSTALTPHLSWYPDDISQNIPFNFFPFFFSKAYAIYVNGILMTGRLNCTFTHTSSPKKIMFTTFWLEHKLSS